MLLTDEEIKLMTKISTLISKTFSEEKVTILGVAGILAHMQYSIFDGLQKTIEGKGGTDPFSDADWWKKTN